jgi:SAM-dependent methyltransferase
MTEHEICEADRKGWDETAAIHERAALSELLEAVRSPNYCTFDAVEQRIFDGINLAGKSVVQLACNNARELIAIRRAGAGACVGFDISDRFVNQAHRLAAAAELDTEVLQSSIYDIPSAYNDRFDLVYITVGALGWLPNLPKLFATVVDLLKSGGQLFIYEMHPFLFLYDEENTDPSDPRISQSYFRDTPLMFAGSRDYLDPEARVELPGYWCHHTLGQILSTLLGAGLALESFEEFAHDISASYAEFAKQAHTLPLCYALVARKVTA